MDPEKLKKLKELLAKGIPLPAAFAMIFGGEGPTIGPGPMRGNELITFDNAGLVPTGPTGAEKDWLQEDFMEYFAQTIPEDKARIHAGNLFDPNNPHMPTAVSGRTGVPASGGSAFGDTLEEILANMLERKQIDMDTYSQLMGELDKTRIAQRSQDYRYWASGTNIDRGLMEDMYYPQHSPDIRGGADLGMEESVLGLSNQLPEDRITEIGLLDPNQMPDELAELMGITADPNDVMMPRLDVADDLAMEISERLKDVQGGIVHTLDEAGNGPLKRFFNTALEKDIPLEQARAMLDTPQRRAIEELSNLANMTVDEVFETLWNEADIVRNRPAVVPRVSPQGLAKFAGGPVDELVMEPIMGALGRAAQKYIPTLASGAARAAGSPIGRTALGALGQIGGAANLIGLAGLMGGSNPINATPMEPLPPIRSPKFIERLFPTPIPRSIKSEAESADRAMLTSAKTLAPKPPLPPRRFRR